jgi:hypothetical protein
MRFQLLLTLLVVFLLPLSTVAAGQENAATPPAKTKEEMDLMRAQTEYYTEQKNKLSEKPAPKSFWQSVSENPASVLGMIGASLAAFVAFLSFGFNYRATLQSQRDTQFYEALKRFGDKDSPSLRASAATTLAQMAVLESRQLRFRHPIKSLFNYQRPYFAISRGHLITGLMQEEDRVTLMITSKLITELMGTKPLCPDEMLRAANYRLVSSYVRNLASFFAYSGISEMKTIDDEKWELVEAISFLSKHSQRALITDSKVNFDRTLLSKNIEAKSKNESDKNVQLVETQQRLGLSAFQLRICAICISSTLKTELGPKVLQNGIELFIGGTNLKEAKLSKFDFHRTMLPEANLAGTDLSEADLSGAQLMGTHLDGTHLWHAKIDEKTDFTDANWWNADFKSGKGELDG